MTVVEITICQRELEALGTDAEIAWTGSGWSARVTIRQKGKRHDTRVSAHGETIGAAKRGCAENVSKYRRLWGERESIDALISAAT